MHSYIAGQKSIEIWFTYLKNIERTPSKLYYE